MSMRQWLVRWFMIIFCWFLLSIFLLDFISGDRDVWFSNIFSDRTYAFQLSPAFLIGVSQIDRIFRTPVMIRIGCRKKVMQTSILAKCCWAFLFLCIWFSMVIIVSCLNYDYINNITIADIGTMFIHYLFGLILLSLLAELFGKSGNKYIAQNSCICALLVLIVEVIVLVPELKINSSFDSPILFSWVFENDIKGMIVLLIAGLLCILYLFKIVSRKDILC